jgi:hypothetical protein
MRKRIRGLEPLTFWLQTNGMLLLAVELYSLACMRLEAHDGRSVRRLLYIAAVRASTGDSPRVSQRRRFYRRSRFASGDRLSPGKLMALVSWLPGVIPQISHDRP